LHQASVDIDGIDVIFSGGEPFGLRYKPDGWQYTTPALDANALVAAGRPLGPVANTEASGSTASERATSAT
jgi:hypothetical protein